MTSRSTVTEFLKEHLDLIRNNDFQTLYTLIRLKHHTDGISLLTDMLLEAQIDPQDYLLKFPPYYLCNSPIQTYDLKLTSFEGTNHFTATNIKSVKLAEGTALIPRSCFAYCTELEQVVIPKSVMLIKAHAFTGCCNLQRIIFEGTIKEWIETVKEDNSMIWFNVPTSYVICTDGRYELKHNG